MGFSELLVILLIAFVVVGPQDLPKVARWLGRLVRQLRLLLRKFKTQTGFDELEREIADTKSGINRDIRRLKDDTDLSRELAEGTETLSKELRGTEQALKEE